MESKEAARGAERRVVLGDSSLSEFFEKRPVSRQAPAAHAKALRREERKKELERELKLGKWEPESLIGIAIDIARIEVQLLVLWLLARFDGVKNRAEDWALAYEDRAKQIARQMPNNPNQQGCMGRRATIAFLIALALVLIALIIVFARLLALPYVP